MFYISLTVHLGIILVNNQLDALFQCIYLFHFSKFSSNPVLIIRRINFINTSSDLYHSVYVTAWFTRQSHTQSDIYRMMYWYNWFSWWLAMGCSKYVLFVFLALQPIVNVFSQPGSGLLASSFSSFLDHTQRRATVGKIPLDEWSIRRRELYLTTHNNHNRQTSMLQVGFEPTISAGERPKTYALDGATTGTGTWNM
jgi:hypothetical protein